MGGYRKITLSQPPYRIKKGFGTYEPGSPYPLPLRLRRTPSLVVIIDGVTLQLFRRARPGTVTPYVKYGPRGLLYNSGELIESPGTVDLSERCANF